MSDQKKHCLYTDDLQNTDKTKERNNTSTKQTTNVTRREQNIMQNKQNNQKKHCLYTDGLQTETNTTTSARNISNTTPKTHASKQRTQSKEALLIIDNLH